MTVIAYKDGVIASDRMGTSAGLKHIVKKIFPYKGGVYALSGDHARGLELIEWHKGNADFGCPQEDRYAQILFIKKGKILLFADVKTPIARKEKIFSMGSGRDFALGAMYQGASAVEAVKIASKLSDSCGMGVDYFVLD